MDINKIMIGGRIGILEFVESDTSPMVRMRVVTNERFTRENGEKVERPTWHNVIGWKQHAQLVSKYYAVGDQILIEGVLRSNKWVDEESGKTIERPEIHIEKLHFTGTNSKKDNTDGKDES